MASVLELSESPDLQQDHHALNLAIWEEVLAEPYFSQIEGRIETNGFGEVLMSPPPAPDHGKKQFKIGYLIQNLLQHGHVSTECPVSTSDGVKGVDVAWISRERQQLLGTQRAYTTAPEICVEVISPSNTRQELDHKKRLYFEAGALEVWFCSQDGAMSFYLGNMPDAPAKSLVAPEMPLQIETF